MKKSLLTSYLLAASVFSFAQSYLDTNNCIYFSHKLLNENQLYDMPSYQYELKPIWSRSQLKINDSIIQYNLFQYIDLTKPGSGCILQNQSGILGKRILHSPNDITLYDNSMEPLLFKTKATLNQQWLVYSNDSLYIIGKVKHVGDTNIFDKTSSYSKVQLLVYKKDSSEYLSNIYNKKYVVYSDSFGIIALPNLSHFPSNKDSALLDFTLCGLYIKKDKTAAGLTLYTRPELLYSINDEFHFSEEKIFKEFVNSNQTKVNTWGKQKVISKNIIGDSIYYKYTHEVKNQNRKTLGNGELVSDTSFSKFDTLVFSVSQFDLVPLIESRLDTIAPLFVKYIYNDCIKAVGVLDGPGNYRKVNDSCWSLIADGGPLLTRSFYTGAGVPTIGVWDLEDFISTYKSVSKTRYASKNGCSWGKPFSTLSLQEKNVEPTFNIYPNPAQNILYVEGKQSIQSLELYSLEGKQHASCKDCNSIDVNTISSGLYILNINIKNVTKVQKKVVIQ